MKKDNNVAKHRQSFRLGWQKKDDHLFIKIGWIGIFLIYSLQFSFAQEYVPTPPDISGGAKAYIEQQKLKAENSNWTPPQIINSHDTNDKNKVETTGRTLSSLLNNWDAIGYGGNSTFFAPPDPIGAAGINHVVNVVNVSIEWYTKAGVLQYSQPLQNFFGSITSTFDPKVIYDQYEDRFVVVTLEQQGRGDANAANDLSNIYVAVSDDGDPNGLWYFTTINAVTTINNTNHWADYPGFAVDEEAVYITNNMFSHASDTYGGSRLWIIDKGVVGGFYAGSTASVNIYNPYAGGGNATTTQPAHTFGTPPAGVGTYLLSQDGGNVAGIERVQFVRVDNPLGAISFTQGLTPIGDITTGFGFPDAPQLGGGTVQTNDRRALNAVYRNGLIATCFTAEGVGPDAGQATAQWVLLNDNGGGVPTLNDAGSISGEDIAPGTFTFFPSVALNMNNDLAIGFSASAPSIWPGAYYTAHESGDPAGTVQPSQTLRAGTLNYNIFSTRWGDYSGMVVDGADDLCFWVFNEYAGQDGGGNSIWATAWGNFCVQACAISNVTLQGPPICDPATPGQNALFSVSFDVSLGSGNYNLFDVANPGTPLGQIIGGSTTGNGLIINGVFPGPTTGQTIMVNVVDANDPNCTGIPISVTLPFCPPVPPNDLCNNAIPLACGADVTTDITTATGTDNPGTCVTLGSNEPGVWYTVAGTGGNIHITTCNPGTNYDTKITIWEGTCAVLNCVTGNDDQSGGFDPDCDVTGIGINRGSTVDFCSTPGTLYYIYLYGFAGNVGTAQMTITCDPPLAVVCPPADLGTLPCGSPIPPAATTVIEFQTLGGTITGGCAPSISHIDNLIGDQCSGLMLTRTYTISDPNNNFDCTQTLTISPPSDPVVICPVDITVACEDDIMLDPDDATVTTDCGLGYAVYIKNPYGNGVPGCNGTVYEYIYKVVDECGRTAACSQFVTIVNTPATISAPAGGTVTCYEDISISVDDATVNNACADYNLYLPAPAVNGPLGCPGSTYTFNFRLVDACGNIVEEPTVYTNGANAAPTIAAPADVTCSCLAGINPNPDNATVTTSCTIGSTVTVSGPQVFGPMNCPGTVYRYTYTVTDDCGRLASDTQDFTVSNGPPVFYNCPGDNWLVLNCEDYGGEAGTIQVIEAWIASVTASTSCSIPLTVFNNFNSNNINTCVNNGYNTVTFRATDNCGRTSFCTGVYVVVDTEAPIITTPAQDHWEMCNYNTQANLTAWVQARGGAVASDGCSGDNISWQASPANPQINCIGAMGTTSVTVQFIVTDNCGNKTNTTATFNALMAPGNDFNDPVEDKLTQDKGMTLLQNRPNPFKDETLIGFNLPEATFATLTIYDVNGRILKVVEANYNQGFNEVSVNRSDLGGAGMKYYTLRTKSETATKIMIIID
jgi:hypothetical protein